MHQLGWKNVPETVLVSNDGMVKYEIYFRHYIETLQGRTERKRAFMTIDLEFTTKVAYSPSMKDYLALGYE